MTRSGPGPHSEEKCAREFETSLLNLEKVTITIIALLFSRKDNTIYVK